MVGKNKADGLTLGCSTLPKTPWQAMTIELVRFLEGEE